jgi:hypothetical protein
MPKLLLYVAKLLIILYSSKNCLQCRYPYGKMTKDKSSWGGFAMSTSQKGDLCQRMVVAHTVHVVPHASIYMGKGCCNPPGHPPAARPILSFLRGDLTPIGKLYIKKNAVLHEFYHTPSPPKIDPMHMYGTISQF